MVIAVIHSSKISITGALCASFALAGCGAGAHLPPSTAVTDSAPSVTSMALRHIEPANTPEQTEPSEPESIAVGPASMTIPNVFVGLAPCGPGTTRSDLRTGNFGELACRDGRGQLDGPYASNQIDPTIDAVSGVAERGQYRQGRRTGTWFQMHWSPERIGFEADTYVDGELAEQRGLASTASDGAPPWHAPGTGSPANFLQPSSADSSATSTTHPASVGSMAD